MKKLLRFIPIAALIAVLFAVSAFALTEKDLEREFGLDITDEIGLLSGDSGDSYCSELRAAFAAYGSPLLSAVEKHFDDEDLPTNIYIVDAPDEYTDGEIIEDDDGVVINLYYSEWYDLDGVNTVTLAHELGHYVHYALDEIAGEKTLKTEWTALNGTRYRYAGDNYDNAWKSSDSAAFAYDYGMSEYYEDVSTICELLVGEPNDMRERLSDSDNKVLRSKTELFKSWISKYIGVSAATLFDPLGSSAAVSGSGTGSTGSGTGTGSTSSGTAASDKIICSAWARTELMSGEDEGLYELPTGVDLSAQATRRDFCEILTEMFTNYYDMTIGEICDFYDESLSDYNFTDISKSDDAIRFCAMMGFVNGSGDGRFSPDKALTRQEAAVILSNVWEYFELPEPDAPGYITDRSSAAKWAVEYIDYVVSRSIMVGDSAGRFNPTKPYSLEQSYITLLRIFDIADEYESDDSYRR